MPIHNAFLFEQNPSNPAQIGISPRILLSTGPIINVEISVPEDLIKYFIDTGLPVPAPVIGPALIDTGASVTAVDVSITKQLNISPVGLTNVFTPQGSAEQALFPIKLSFAGWPIGINFSSVLGSELKNQGIMALIGRDVLSQCILVYNGPAGHFSLSM